MMKLSALFATIALVGFLAGCQGAHTALPLPTSAQPASAHPIFVQLPAIRAQHTGLLYCRVRPAILPGTYVVLMSNGNVTGGSYSAIDGSWQEARFTASSQPEPPGPNPPTQATYLYSGSYTLDLHHQVGCAYLETTVGGEPFEESKNNASLAGVPHFDTLEFASTPTASGYIQIGPLKINGTSATASLKLMRRNGTIFDYGTLRLTERHERRGP